jgi:hypothetical protein
MPIVDHATAYRLARERLGAVRRKDETRRAAEKVLLKHGSRKRPANGTAPKYRSASTRQATEDLLL